MKKQTQFQLSQLFGGFPLWVLFSLLLCCPSSLLAQTYEHDYHQAPLSEILYDLSTHFDYNTLILDLEHRTGSYNFKKCSMEDCLYQLHLGQQLWFLTAESFAAFTRNENYIGNWVKKKKKLQLQLEKREYPKVSISYQGASLHTVLTYLVEEMNLPLQISNRVTAKVTLNLKEANGFEVFFYLLTFYKLTVLEDYGKKVVLPEVDFDR